MALELISPISPSPADSNSQLFLLYFFHLAPHHLIDCSTYLYWLPSPFILSLFSLFLIFPFLVIFSILFVFVIGCDSDGEIKVQGLRCCS